MDVLSDEPGRPDCPLPLLLNHKLLIAGGTVPGRVHVMKLLVLFFLAGMSLDIVAAEKPVHLFVLSGQSNMAGMKEKDGFLPEAGRLLPDATVAHIKVASGGQPIRLWLTEWPVIATKAGVNPDPKRNGFLYEQILAQFNAMKKKHPGGFASITFCWMQGERDAKGGTAKAYETALKTLITKLRKDLEAPKMAFVIGRLSDHSPGKTLQDDWDLVRAVQVKIADADPLGAWVDTDDCNNKERNGKKLDDLHYTKDGYKLFGERLARQAVRIIDGKKPDVKGRPE